MPIAIPSRTRRREFTRPRAPDESAAAAHNATVRLIHRDRAGAGSLEEGDCYENSYGEHVLDHVDLVDLERAETQVELPPPEQHVTTKSLKRQFEERLAARARRRR
jgi:hypothetical protein